MFSDDSTNQAESQSDADVVRLPRPVDRGGMSVEEALQRRRSVREFTNEPLSAGELSQLLWALQGVTHPEGLRTAPSAGALYPLEIYVALPHGFYHYEPERHELRRITPDDRRRAIHRAALQQDSILQAPAVFVLTAVYDRLARKYGDARARRYTDMEAAHAAQNALLEAVALELGGVPIGAFHDARLARALALPRDHAPLYLLPIGHPGH